MSERAKFKERKSFKEEANDWISRGAYDKWFLTVVLVLLAIGLVMLYSASYVSAYYGQGGDSGYYFKAQLKWAVIGLLVMFVASKINYQKLKLFPIPVLVLLVSLALLVIVLFYHTSFGGRWLAGPVPFQPSELAKVALVWFFAWSMERHHMDLIGKNPRGLKGRLKTYRYVEENGKKKIVFSARTKSFLWTLFYAAILGCFCLLVILENHLSGTILIFALGLSMMWFGEVPGKWIALGFAVVAGIVLAVALIKPELLGAFFEDYMLDRLYAWWDKSADPLGDRWQINQSLIAIGSGGFWGVGLGNSKQKHLYVPELQNDFIFSIICEELGFIGAFIIILLFIFLVWRGFVIASNAKDRFGALLASGLVMQVGMQAAFNIAVVTDFFPNTGISLPFFSSGGTSLLVLMASMGIVLSISKYSRIEKNY